MGRAVVFCSVLLVGFALTCCVLTPSPAIQIRSTAAIRAGYALADSCVTPALQRQWRGVRWSVDDLNFFVTQDSVWGADQRIVAEDFGRNIYVADWMSDQPWIWAHEIVHAFGIKGHPFVPFYSCALMWKDAP